MNPSCRLLDLLGSPPASRTDTAWTSAPRARWGRTAATSGRSGGPPYAATPWSTVGPPALPPGPGAGPGPRSAPRPMRHPGGGRPGHRSCAGRTPPPLPRPSPPRRRPTEVRGGERRGPEDGEKYWRLLTSGVGTAAACRAVGITRKIGYRWRAENGWRAAGPSRRGGANEPLPLAARAATDRHPARPRSRRAGDRPPDCPGTLHSEPGAAAQPASARPGPLRRRPRPRPGASPATTARPAEPGLRVAAGRAGPARAGLDPGADRRVTCRPSTPTGRMARLPRDDLPGALLRRGRWSEQGVDPPTAHRTTPA